MAKLETCHPDLKRIMLTAITNSPVDFGISEGYRSVEDQQRYFAEGKSKLDGLKHKSKHNYDPSMACDIYVWLNGKASWNAETLSYLAGFIEATARMLWRLGSVKHLVRWGGNWDMDGEIISDQNFVDRPHFELYYEEKI